MVPGKAPPNILKPGCELVPIEINDACGLVEPAALPYPGRLHRASDFTRYFPIAVEPFGNCRCEILDRLRMAAGEWEGCGEVRFKTRLRVIAPVARRDFWQVDSVSLKEELPREDVVLRRTDRQTAIGADRTFEVSSQFLSSSPILTATLFNSQTPFRQVTRVRCHRQDKESAYKLPGIDEIGVR
jgi:hypothetical protein